jgi:hypothetical protein
MNMIVRMPQKPFANCLIAMDGEARGKCFLRKHGLNRYRKGLMKTDKAIIEELEGRMLFLAEHGCIACRVTAMDSIIRVAQIREWKHRETRTCKCGHLYHKETCYAEIIDCRGEIYECQCAKFEPKYRKRNKHEHIER